MLFFAKPEVHQRIHAALPGLLRVPFRFEGLGSQIVFYQQETPIVRDFGWTDEQASAAGRNAFPLEKAA